MGSRIDFCLEIMLNNKLNEIDTNTPQGGISALEVILAF
jgi:hypothetical protein